MMERDRTRASAALAAALAVGLCGQVLAARIKDITTIEGVRSNQLYGVGLVAGLADTGDDNDFTAGLVRNMLARMRIGRGLEELDTGNLAAVIVTAQLPPFAHEGERIDVTVSTMDEGSSLRGGTLLLTPLFGADGEVYAVAQGPVSVGGFAFAGAAAAVQQGHPTVGRIPGGATVEKAVPSQFIRDGTVSLCLRAPDFATAVRIASVIEAQTRAKCAVADAGTVRVSLSRPGDRNAMMEEIGRIQLLQVEPDVPALVVINERTGTVVAGQNVGIASVAVSHGNLTVVTQELPQVSQPGPLSGGKTRVVPRTALTILEKPLKEGGLAVLNRGTSVADVARALNMLGASPRDIISIFQAIKEAGALHAELRIM